MVPDDARETVGRGWKRDCDRGAENALCRVSSRCSVSVHAKHAALATLTTAVDSNVGNK